MDNESVGNEKVIEIKDDSISGVLVRESIAHQRALINKAHAETGLLVMITIGIAVAILAVLVG